MSEIGLRSWHSHFSQHLASNVPTLGNTYVMNRAKHRDELMDLDDIYIARSRCGPQPPYAQPQKRICIG